MATQAGIAFAGPSPESIEAFGLKHRARELAIEAGVPIVPGTQSLVKDEDEAVEASKKLGFPVFDPHSLSLLFSFFFVQSIGQHGTES